MDTALTLRLSRVPETFAICRLNPDLDIPRWAMTGMFFSVTRTRDELSLICPQVNVPDRVVANRGWRCLKVDGPLPFTTIGVVATLAAPLAAAGISIFVVSSYDTDYLLVKAEDLGNTVEVLVKAGHEVSV